MTPDVADYLLKTPRSNVQIAGVSMRTIDRWRAEVGASRKYMPRKWWRKIRVAHAVITMKEAKAADILGITVHQVDWARRQLRKIGICTKDDVVSAAKRIAERKKEAAHADA